MNVDAPSASPAGGAFSTSAASYGINTTPLASSGPPVQSNKTLAHHIADLQRNLRDAFDSSLARVSHNSTARGQQLSAQYEHDIAQLHPLAVSTGLPAGPPGSTLKLPWELLTTALGNFEHQILNNAEVLLIPLLGETNQFVPPPTAGVSDKDRIRLLALMRETGALTLADLATEEGVHRAEKIVARRKDYKFGFPGNFTGHKNVKEILESIAKDAGWETFQGADDTGGLADENGMDTGDTPFAASISHTITMAGKGVVLDVDFDSPSRKESAEASAQAATTKAAQSVGSVTAVRFSYGLEGSTDAGVDKLLSRQAKASDWPAMRESILALASLDDIVGPQESTSRDEEAGGVDTANDPAASGDLDPFSALKALSMKLEEIFQSELEVVSSAANLFTLGHGLATSYHALPYTDLIFHPQPYILHTEEWDRIVQSGFQNEEMAALLRFDEGILSMTFKVQKLRAPPPLALSLNPELMDTAIDTLKSSFSLLPSPPANLTQKIANGLHFVAKLNKPLIITAAVGRRVQDILYGGNTTSSFPVTQVSGFPLQGQFLSTLQAQPAETLEKVLLSEKVAGLLYELDMRDMGDCPTLKAKLLPLSTGVPAFKLEQFSFETVDQLLATVEILRIQACYNDMLSTLFDGSRSNAASQLDMEAQITLESLLSDTPLSVIDVSVQTDTDMSWPPAITLRFILPHLPSWLPIVCIIRICPSFAASPGYSVSCDFISTDTDTTAGLASSTSIGSPKTPEKNTRLEQLIFGENGNAKDDKQSQSTSRAIMEEILATSGDPKLVIKYLGGKVLKASASIKSLYAR